MPRTLRFLGAAGTVTGSKYLVDGGQGRFLMECGLFQGLKPLRLRNWDKFPFSAAEIQSVVLSHAHLDHSGALPLRAKQGFKGKVHCTPETKELLGVLLPDSARLQEEEAGYANRKGYSKHRPALPLYDEKDAQAALGLAEPHAYEADFSPAAGVAAKFRDAGHILGAGTVGLKFDL